LEIGKPVAVSNSFDKNQPLAYNITDKVTRRRCEMANQVGKRYTCTKCGAEFIVTKGGEGTITCCGQPMEQKK
jgi:desulfoferrodoxin-like iron-binding protein